MPAPAPLVELRQFARRATIEDIANGLNPIRQNVDGKTVLYWMPELQFRYQVKNSDGTRAWTAWASVPIVREGVDE